MENVGLISHEQFEKLNDLPNSEIEQISNVLKEAKIGQGISFLPTSVKDLRLMFGELWKDGVKGPILPVLKELLRRGAVTIEEFTILVDELDRI